MNNTHQQPSSSSEQDWKERLHEQFPDGITKEDWFEVIDFITVLLTSHSEAIRERVAEKKNTIRKFSNDNTIQADFAYGYREALDDILPLLTDEV